MNVHRRDGLLTTVVIFRDFYPSAEVDVKEAIHDFFDESSLLFTTERTWECTILLILKCLAFLKILCFWFLFYFPLLLLTTGRHIGPCILAKSCAEVPKSGYQKVTLSRDRKNDEKLTIFTRASRKGFELRCTFFIVFRFFCKVTLDTSFLFTRPSPTPPTPYSVRA